MVLLRQIIILSFTFLAQAASAPGAEGAADFCAAINAPADARVFARANHLPKGATYRRMRGLVREIEPIFARLCTEPSHADALAQNFLDSATNGRVDCKYINLAPSSAKRAPAKFTNAVAQQLDLLTTAHDQVMALLKQEEGIGSRDGELTREYKIYLGSLAQIPGVGETRERGILGAKLDGMRAWILEERSKLSAIAEVASSMNARTFCGVVRKSNNKWDAPAKAFASANTAAATGSTYAASEAAPAATTHAASASTNKAASHEQNGGGAAAGGPGPKN